MYFILNAISQRLKRILARFETSIERTHWACDFWQQIADNSKWLCVHCISFIFIFSYTTTKFLFYLPHRNNWVIEFWFVHIIPRIGFIATEKLRKVSVHVWGLKRLFIICRRASPANTSRRLSFYKTEENILNAMALNGFLEFFQKGKVCTNVIINRNLFISLIIVIISTVHYEWIEVAQCVRYHFRRFDQKSDLLRERYAIHYTNKLRPAYSPASIWGKWSNCPMEKI